jgi:hypothetical protein
MEVTKGIKYVMRTDVLYLPEKAADIPEEFERSEIILEDIHSKAKT